MSKWISVKDRLPNILEGESAEVLVINSDGEIQVGGQYQWIEEKPPQWWTYRYGGTDDDTVTHWMLLPEKP